MVGLVPTIHALLPDFLSGTDPDSFLRMKGGWVYILTNRPNGILYIGVTSDISRRSWEHREGLIKGFATRYGLKTLVYYAWFDDILSAIQREKTMKAWPRAWKVRAIMERNPEWRDLYDELVWL